jgi:serine protease Do
VSKRILVWMAAALVVAFVAGGVAAPRLWSADAAKPVVDRMTPQQQEAVQGLKAFSQGFEAVAEAVAPSVVTVTSEKTVQPAASPFDQFHNDPFFRRFFGDPGQGGQSQPYTQRGLGSGVVVGEDGVILTNNHVVRGADELTVILYDGTRLPAKVLGSDARTDIAVLKVDTDHLVAMPFGNSDGVKIGQWVLAVGSPFSENLQHTVTAGIVSAVGRSGMNLNEYEDFIQTDAAINPGNSGGALVNLDGELVGINSAIASRTGGSNGIGFAIPSNMAMEVMDDLITNGKVTRGWLGVTIQNVTPDLRDALDLGSTQGVLVNSVVPDSPADDAGLQQGDVLVALDGRPMKDSSELRLAAARANPGDRVEVTILRDGKERRLQLTLGEFPEDDATVAGESGQSYNEEIGLTVEPITPDLSRRFELPDGAEGLLITAVAPGSPADDSGIQPGDLVVKVNRNRVNSVADYRTALGSVEEGSPVLFLLNRSGNMFFVAVRPKS